MENISKLLSEIIKSEVIFSGQYYTYRGAFSLSTKIKKDPELICKEILSNIDLPDGITAVISRGMINFNLEKEFISKQIKHILKSDNLIKKSKTNKKVLVDFSSPNIAKDMHVGHLRSTIIGESICRLLEYVGEEVLRINHIGDFGLQFGMIIQHLLDNVPDFEKNGINISELQSFYAESKKQFDTDENFKKKAYQRVVELQQGDTEVVKAWEYIKEVSRKAYSEIYSRLDIKLEEVGESFYQKLIPSVIEEVKNKNLIIQDEGRMIMFTPTSNIPLTLIKSDGGYTYDTTDLAALYYRLIKLDCDKIIYVVDNGQSEHFKVLFSAAKLAGWLTTQDVLHVGFGVVLNEKGQKFKSRDGNTVKLIDLLNEGINRTSQLRKINNMSEEEHNAMVESISYSSIKYADLSSTRTKDYRFSFDSMLSLTGNTAPYLLYAYVRLSAILRNASNYYMEALNKIDDFEVTNQLEINLCNKILQYPEIIEKIKIDYMFHSLCNYIYEIATSVQKFSEQCRCLNYDSNKKIISANYNRLLICHLTCNIMKDCFYILGIKPIEKM